MIETKIEWCDSTWNPVSGCLHTCEYCYARAIANRFGGCDDAPDGKTDQRIITLTERKKVTRKNGKTINAAYPYGFTPTLHEYRLSDPLKKGFGETIFVCSTADLFGEWVPDEWIEKVFDACKAAWGHRYLFLTKNPSRYLKLAEAGKLPKGDSFWYGSTTTSPEDKFFFSDSYNTFVSVEPILAPFKESEGNLEAVKKIDWAIFGAETGNRKNLVVPKRDWIEDYVRLMQEVGKPVFMKDSLRQIWGDGQGEDKFLTQTPWGK